MLYAILASALGAAGIALTLWRKALVERELAVTKLLLQTQADAASQAAKAVIDNEIFYSDQTSRLESVIAGLRSEIEALHAITPSGAVRSGLLSQIGVKLEGLPPLMDPREQ